MTSLRCSSCNIAFHDNGSLEVHFQYAHSNSENVAEPARTEHQPDADTTENNNNFFKFQGIDNSNDSVMTAISPGTDSREFQLPALQPRDIMYDVTQQNYQDNYMMNSQEYSRTSPNVTNYTFSPNDHHRYQPYYKPGFRELPRNPIGTPLMPVRCDKCDFFCPSQDVLLQHYTVAHGAASPINLQSFNPRFGNQPVNGGAEPQAEILDLDSHKVHVYQPPNGEDSHDGDQRLDPWMPDEKKYFHQHMQSTQQNGANGKHGTPLPSPDFGSVSTTTDNIENLQSTRSPFYDQNPVNSAPAQISSSDNPTGRSSSKNSKNSNGTWKSNEARRPKTYNCSACNKWFTSSGHLKRHYNTTLHKNAVKQSGAPDPATLPVSAHHHPHKDPTYSSSRQVKNSPPVSESSDTPPSKLNDGFNARNSTQIPPNAFLHNSPNLMGGPSEMPGGLLHHPSYTPTPDLIKSPSPISSIPQHSNHTNYLPFGTTSQPSHTLPFFQQPQPSIYPNFQSPHVSTTHQVTTNNLTGNLTNVPTMSASTEDCKTLPSFSCIQKNNWNSQNLGLEQFLNTLEEGGNVGGSFASVDVENATKYILQDLSSDKLNYKSESSESLEDEGFVSMKDIDLPRADDRVEQLSKELLERMSPLEESKVSSSTAEQVPAERGYNCNRCQKHFNKACYLTQHNKSFHSGYKPFKCGRCGKRFQDTEQFKVHSDKHAGDKPYKCEICPKQFNHKTDLRRHACLHTNIRPFACDICSKGFIRKDHMLKHRETHQNRKNVQKRSRIPKIKKVIDFDK